MAMSHVPGHNNENMTLGVASITRLPEPASGFSVLGFWVDKVDSYVQPSVKPIDMANTG